MTISGRIVYSLPIKVGKKSDGTEWQSKGYVIEEIGNSFPQRLLFFVSGTDDMMYFNLKIGDIVAVKFEMDVSRHDDSFYNIATAYSIVRIPPEKMGYMRPERAKQVEKKRRNFLKKLENERGIKRKGKGKVDINSLPF